MAVTRSLKTFGLVLAISLATFTVSAEQVSAQYGAPTVSAVTLQTVPGQDGQQMVITPKGITVPLPGPGVNSNVVEVYIGSQGGYWYVDKNGQQFDLTQYVARFQQMQGQRPNMQPVQTPEYAPAPAPVQVNNYESSSSNNSGGSGGSGVGTAVAAGLGAMAGSAISGAYNYPYANTSYWHGVPYGTPYHYNGNNGYAYVNRGGNTVNVDPNITRTNNVNRTANVNATQVNSTVNSASATQNNYMRQQQDWYNNQAKANSQQFQNWKSNSNAQNPFVNSDAKYGWGNGQGATAAAGEGGRFGQNDANAGGRFGGANAANEGGGRFGGANAASEGGGRFGGAAGGRFGGAAEGGRFGGGRRRGR